MEKPTFEKSLPEIDRLILSRKYKWRLSQAIPSIDYDDVSQLLRIHIFQKWDQYQSEMGPLANWINKIISNQIQNMIRDNYHNFASPCSSCSHNQGSELCSYCVSGYKSSEECPLLLKWEKGKKRAHDVKLPVSSENHQQEIYQRIDESINLHDDIVEFHKEMIKVLGVFDGKVYSLLFIKGLDEDRAIIELGFTHLTRKAALIIINKSKKIIQEKAKEVRKEIGI